MEVPLRLGYLVPEFPRQTHIFFWRELQALRKLGVDPVLLSTRRPAAEACPHPFRDAAVTSTTYLFPPTVGGLIRLFCRPGAFLRGLRRCLTLKSSMRTRIRQLGLLWCAEELRRVCRSRRISHIHVHSCADAALLVSFAQALAGRSHPLTYSLTLHNPLSGHGPHQAEKWRHAAFGIVVANVFLEELGRELSGNLPETILVAPMGVDLAEFARLTPYAPRKNDEPLRIFACGRLNPCKGHDLLIRAVGVLIKEGRPVTLEIAGEDQDSGTGQHRRDLETTIAELGLGNTVRLLGVQSENQVREHLRRAHVFVLASRTGEAMPVVLLEAMAIGLPCIATDVGGTKELVRDSESGFVIPAGEPEAIAGALRTLTDDPALCERFAAIGRAIVENGYSSDVNARAILSGLNSIGSGIRAGT
jgi:colanic acid/amylovoran biosynthesis glycosyltransferase